MKLNTIIEGDSLLVMQDIPSNYIDIIITSPPYNATHSYDNYNDNKEFKDYINNMTDIFRECYRILKEGGRICVNVPFAIKNKETKNVSFISHYIASILNDLGFRDFEWITWHKGKNMNHFQGNNTAWGSWKSPSCPSFRPLGEAIMVFYKGEKQHRGDKSQIDITGEEFKEWTKNTWYFNEDDNNIYDNLMCIPNDAKKKNHPAPYPNELVERLIKLYSYKDDIVLDPFNGIGTTTYVSEKLNRKYIGIELSKKYCDLAIDRLKNGAKIVYSDNTSKLVNSSSNEGTLTVVFPYKESFSPNLVPYLVGRNLKNYDSMLVISHFKGHPMGGFGGALKNISIGTASSRGKAYIHGAGDESKIWTAEHDLFLESMADASKSIMDYFKGNIAFINIMCNMSVDCDCCSEAKDPCMKDIGILASLDPVALDQACIDLVYKSNDPGKKDLIERIESRNGIHTILSASSIGVGTREYELIDIDK